MKYVWMLILGIAWMWWTVEVIKDVWYCDKQFYHPFQHIKVHTKIWVVTHLALTSIAFIASIMVWLKEMIGG